MSAESLINPHRPTGRAKQVDEPTGEATDRPKHFRHLRGILPNPATVVTNAQALFNDPSGILRRDPGWEEGSQETVRRRLQAVTGFYVENMKGEAPVFSYFGSMFYDVLPRNNNRLVKTVQALRMMQNRYHRPEDLISLLMEGQEQSCLLMGLTRDDKDFHFPIRSTSAPTEHHVHQELLNVLGFLALCVMEACPSHDSFRPYAGSAGEVAKRILSHKPRKLLRPNHRLHSPEWNLSWKCLCEKIGPTIEVLPSADVPQPEWMFEGAMIFLTHAICSNTAIFKEVWPPCEWTKAAFGDLLSIMIGELESRMANAALVRSLLFSAFTSVLTLLINEIRNYLSGPK